MIPLFDDKKIHIVQRKSYLESILNKSLRTIFRPENREPPHEKSYSPGQLALIKVLDIPGSSHHEIDPVYISDIASPVRIGSTQAKTMADLEMIDYLGAGQWISDRSTLAQELAATYNLGTEVNDDDFMVTVTKFEYLNPREVEIISR